MKSNVIVRLPSIKDVTLKESDISSERLQLLKASKSRVKTWTDTKYGAILLKLKDIENRKKAQEDARAEIDRRWEELLANEKKEFLAHTRRLQLSQTAEARKIHSKLLLDQVLHEREFQIKHKQRLDDNENRVNLQEQAFADLIEAKKMKKPDCLLTDQDVLTSNNTLKQERIRMREIEKNKSLQDTMKIIQESQRLKDEEIEKKRLKSESETRAIKSGNDELIAFKHRILSTEADKIEQDIRKDIDEYNLYILARQNYIEDVKKREACQRQRHNEAIAKITQKMNKEALQRKEAFIEQFALSEDGFLNRLLNNNNKLNRDDQIYLKQEAEASLARKAIIRKQEYENKLHERERTKKELEQYEMMQKQTVAEKQRKARELMEIHLTQLSNHKIKEEQWKIERIEWKRITDEREKEQRKALDEYEQELTAVFGV